MNGLVEARQYLTIGQRAGQIPELDGLRGIAILLVILRHAVLPVYEQHGQILKIGNWDIAIPLMNGWMGVDLFFVLSGFLITHHLIRRWPAEFNRSFALRYWSKRILRTFPAFYAAVLIAFFGVIPLFDPNVEDSMYSLSVHILFMQDYLGSDLVAAFWSLGVEEKFYLVCPLVLVLLRKFALPYRILMLVLLAILPAALRVATILSNEGQLLNYQGFFWVARAPFHLAMDGLWIGVICALIYNADLKIFRNNNRLARSIGMLSLGVLLVVMFSRAWFDDLYFLPSAIVLNVIAVAFGGVLLSICIGNTPISRLLRSRWLRVLSVLSYSIYLMHLMIVPLALDVTARIFGSLVDAPLWHFVSFLSVLVVLSVVAAMFLHFLIEKPFLIVKDKIRL